MSNRAQQKKKERKSQKRQQKKQEQRRVQGSQFAAKEIVVPQANARHRERLARQQPTAWQGELPEDAALFDDAVCASLPPEVVEQVGDVRAALQAAGEGRGDEALKRTAMIPRSSLLSEWRLFVRGLVSWLRGDTADATEAWKRLDPERRAARIAAVMLTALRADLEQISEEKLRRDLSQASSPVWTQRLDDLQIYHAKLLRRVRFERAAIRVAETMTRTPDEAKELLIGPKKIQWLKGFAQEYRATEPNLVASLERVALNRAYNQAFGDVFEVACTTLKGPRHDKRNLLLGFFYEMQFEEELNSKFSREAEQYLQKYITVDLPSNEDLTPQLRQALLCQIHLNRASMLIRPRSRGFMGMLFGFDEDQRAVRSLLQQAQQAYPQNRRAYTTHISWIESQLEYDGLTAANEKSLQTELAKVNKQWVQALPDDAEPRLWLVDYLIENEKLAEAKPHVDWLAGSRQEDPRIRATPWKWQLMEAMALSRLKKSLPKVPVKLETAATIWPAWLSQQWLPYLEAAVLLRSGKTAEFEQRRQQICQDTGIIRDSLADACMLLGAAQKMNLPSAALKPLRMPVDAAVKNVGKLTTEELLQASQFFWDWHRAGLLYPAYRMHSSKFAQELWQRLVTQPGLVLSEINNTQMQAAVLWCAERGMLRATGNLKLPKWYETPAIQKHPFFAAAVVLSQTQLRYQSGVENYINFGKVLRAEAPAQRDPYYRHWFVALADKLDAAIASRSSRMFGGMFGWANEANDERDPDCDCEHCRAHRAAQ